MRTDENSVNMAVFDVFKAFLAIFRRFWAFFGGFWLFLALFSGLELFSSRHPPAGVSMFPDRGS